MKYEDVEVFGEDQWVYCDQHMRPHLTGWCTVHVDNKVGLGLDKTVESQKVYSKCRKLGLRIFGDNS